MVRVGIVGGTGYVALELTRLLCAHEGVQITRICSHSAAEENMADLYPSLAGMVDLPLVAFNAADIAQNCDVAFLCLPHAASGQAILALHALGVPIIDLSADLRYDSADVYAAWYGGESVVSHLLPKKVYGLTELYGDQVATSDLIGNPGCYTTCAILALYPLLAHKLVSPKGIIVNSASGVSGAGKNANATTHFCNAFGNINAYGAAKHRHTSEMEQELSKAAGQDLTLTFVPHLLPVKRGILSTIYADLEKGANAASILGAYQSFYKDKPFVRLQAVGQLPHLKHVVGSNCVDIGFTLDTRNNKVIIGSALDNMIKGAAGQAVQNMNRRFGFEETCGLPRAAWFL